MDIISALKGDNQRHVVAHFFPGMIALWPFALMVQSGLGVEIDLTNEFQVFFLAALYVLVALGLGVFLEDLGSLVELRLEAVYFDLKSRDRKVLSEWDKELNIRSLFSSVIRHTTACFTIFCPANSIREWLLGCHLKEPKFKTAKEVKEDFYKTWQAYLSVSFKEGEEPVAMRYYRAVLIRFKFEINTCVALLLMLFGHLVFNIYDLGLSGLCQVLDVKSTLLYLGAICVTASILIIEAFKMIELLDEIRCQLVIISNKQST